MVLVAYPLSFGPGDVVHAQLLNSGRQWKSGSRFLTLYIPLHYVASLTATTQDLLKWYVHIWAPNVHVEFKH